MKATKEEQDRAERQARAQLASIVEMIDAIVKAEMNDDDDALDAAREAVALDPLSVEVRSGWQSLGEPLTASEFSILLCTGGPAVRIVGDLNDHNEPERPRLQYQDWFTPWVELVDINEAQREALEAYCRQFYFGD